MKYLMSTAFPKISPENYGHHQAFQCLLNGSEDTSRWPVSLYVNASFGPIAHINRSVSLQSFLASQSTYSGESSHYEMVDRSYYGHSPRGSTR